MNTFQGRNKMIYCEFAALVLNWSMAAWLLGQVAS